VAKNSHEPSGLLLLDDFLCDPLQALSDLDETRMIGAPAILARHILACQSLKGQPIDSHSGNRPGFPLVTAASSGPESTCS
jgi:hypothetical protein